MFRNTRFTLIELLIVIGIIALLAAMLLPALARAKYMARIVTCMNSQKQIGVAVTAFASDNQNKYPQRGAMVSGNDGPGRWYVPTTNMAWPMALSSTKPDGTYSGSGGFDDRDLLDEVYPINELQCAFAKPLDLKGNTAAISVLSTYSLFFGWGYTSPFNTATVAGNVMRRQGLNFKHNANEFDILLGDFTTYRTDRDFYFASHTDRNGSHTKLYVSTKNNFCWSKYEWKYKVPGFMDMSFVRKDGSAFTVRNTHPYDNRLTKVPYNLHETDFPNRYMLLPDVNFSE